VCFGAARLGQGGGKAGRTLLQESDVPLRRGEQLGELGEQLAVDLDVRLVALLDPQQP
jgi:hypothetical protein